jgi:hypothetical protein
MKLEYQGKRGEVLDIVSANDEAELGFQHPF